MSEILRRFRLPNSDQNVFHIGCDCTLQTLYSQQKRALNLVHAILTQDNPPQNIAIIGGGLAGITAATAFLSQRCPVTVYEKSGRYLNLQYNNSTRYLHPNIYDWPAGSAVHQETALPFLNWRAGLAKDVAERISHEWNSIRDWGTEQDLLVEYLETTVHPNLAVYDSRTLQLSGNQKSTFVTNTYDCLILAIGFGLEKAVGEVGFQSYWETDTLGDSDKSGAKKNILITGTGDGGLTDLLRARIEGFRHERFAEFLQPVIDQLTEPLLTIEREAKELEESQQSVHLWKEYSQIRDSLPKAFLADFRDNKLRPDTEVVLNGRGTTPLSLKASILNRVLAFFVACEDGFRWMPGRLEPTSLSARSGPLTRYRVSLPGLEDDVFHQVVIRHGTTRPLPDWASEPVSLNSESGSAHPHWPTDYYPKDTPWPQVGSPLLTSAAAATLLKTVSDLYGSFGFDVWRLPVLDGKQFDLRLRRVEPGIGLQTHLVQCIDDDVPTIERLREEAGVFGAVDYDADRWIIVTRGELPDGVNLLRKEHKRLRFVTVKELKEKIFNVRETYSRYLSKYRNSPIAASYIPLSANQSNTKTAAVSDIADIEESILNWFGGNASGFLFVLGDFGSGKTTLLERLKYRIAEDILTGSESHPLPVLFRLREFYECGTVANFVNKTMASEFGHTIPVSTFWEAASEGRFLFLLDGFDEMSAENTARTRRERMLELSRFLKCRGMSIVTCRPAHYTSRDELSSVASLLGGFSAVDDFEITARRQKYEKRKTNNTTLAIDKDNEDRAISRHAAVRDLHDGILSDVIGVDLGKSEALDQPCFEVTLRSLSEIQIKSFLSQSDARFRQLYGIDHISVYNFLQSVYDLSDLVKRPILLDIIVYTILKGAIDPTNSTTPLNSADLYRAYTSVQFKRDYSKGASRRFMSEATRSLFGQALAITMLESQRLEVSYDDVMKVVRENRSLWEELKNARGDVTEEEVAGDVLTCSFVTRTDSDMFRFAHKSFMEYFVALRIVEEALNQARRIKALEGELNREILFFLGGFGQSDPRFFTWIVRKAKEIRSTKGEQVQRNNLASIVFSCNGSVEPVEIRRAETIDTSSKALVLSLAKLERVSVKKANFGTLRLIRSELEHCDFDECQADSLEFEHGDIQISLNACELDTLRVAGGRFTASCSGTSLGTVLVETGTVKLTGDVSIASGRIFGGGLCAGPKVVVSGVESKDCELELEGQAYELAFSGGVFSGQPGSSVTRGLYRNSVFKASGQPNARVTINNSTFFETEITSKSADYADVKIECSKVALNDPGLTKVEFVDCESVFDDKVKAATIKITGGSFRVVGVGRRTLDKSTISGAEIVLRQCDVRSSTFHECSGKLEKGSTLTDCQLEGGSLSITGEQQTGSVSNKTPDELKRLAGKRRAWVKRLKLLKNGRLEGGALAFEQLEITDSTLNVDDCSVNGLTAQGSVVSMTYGDRDLGDISDGQLCRTEFTILGPGKGEPVTISGMQFDDSTVRAERCKITQCTFVRTKALLDAGVAVTGVLDQCQFDESEVYLRFDSGITMRQFVRENIQLASPPSCLMVGLPISHADFESVAPLGVYLTPQPISPGASDLFVHSPQGSVGVVVSALYTTTEKEEQRIDESLVLAELKKLRAYETVSSRVIEALTTWLHSHGFLSSEHVVGGVKFALTPSK